MKTLKEESAILNSLSTAERDLITYDAGTMKIEEYFKKHPVQLAVLIKIVEIAIFFTFAKPVLQLSLKALLLVLQAQQKKDYESIIY